MLIEAENRHITAGSFSITVKRKTTKTLASVFVSQIQLDSFIKEVLENQERSPLENREYGSVTLICKRKKKMYNRKELIKKRKRPVFSQAGKTSTLQQVKYGREEVHFHKGSGERNDPLLIKRSVWI